MGASGAGRSSATFWRWRWAVRSDWCWVKGEVDLWSLFLSSMLHLWNLSSPCCGEQCAKRKKEHLEAWRHQTPDLYICYTDKGCNDYRPRDGPKEVLFFLFFSSFFNYHCCYANCVKLLQTPCFQKICHEEAKEALFHCKCQWIIPRWLIYPPNHTRWRSCRRISSEHHYTVLQCC